MHRTAYRQRPVRGKGEPPTPSEPETDPWTGPCGSGGWWRPCSASMIRMARPDKRRRSKTRRTGGRGSLRTTSETRPFVRPVRRAMARQPSESMKHRCERSRTSSPDGRARSTSVSRPSAVARSNSPSTCSAPSIHRSPSCAPIVRPSLPQRPLPETPEHGRRAPWSGPPIGSREQGGRVATGSIHPGPPLTSIPAYPLASSYRGSRYLRTARTRR